MSWKTLSGGSKLVVAFGGAAAVGGFVYYWGYPVNRELFRTFVDLPEANGLVASKCDEAFKTLQDSESCQSLLKKYLTRNVLDKLKYRKTKLGATLLDVIQSGAANLDSGVGVYTPDAESYKVFKELFDPIIADYHGTKTKQPPVDLGIGKEDQFPDLDPEGKYIVSTRVRCARSVKGYPFNPLLSEDDYLILERKMKDSLTAVDDEELQGTYYPLQGMDKKTQDKLVEDHFLFKEGDRFLQAAKACNYWPKGRGIYHNKDKTFLVWLNEEDHLRIISMDKGGDVGKILTRLNKAIQTLESKMTFSRDDRLGWLTFCPTNLGSSVRASVHIRLPNLTARKDFNEVCSGLNLQVRGIRGEHSESEGGVYDVSNKQRLGLSEFEAVKQMYDGVKTLIDMENQGVKK